MTANRVVVGHDGSPAADTALRWALRAAAARGGAVEVVRAFDLDPLLLLTPVPLSEADVEGAAQAARAATDDAVERARAAVPEAAQVPVTATVVRGASVPLLAEASRGAALLVVGRRGAGRVRLLLGSTSTALVRAARCPVALVPADEPATTGPVVVGWDGSPAGEAAVRWAADEAAATGARLDVVVGWQITGLHSAVVQRHAGDLSTVPPLAAYEEVAAAEAQAGADLARRHAGDRLPADAVRGCAVHAPAATALLESGAGLLVVGSRGRGGFAQLVLGSTTDQVTRHARCPVVVVRRVEDPVEDGG